jgi:hypothetical protein
MKYLPSFAFALGLIVNSQSAAYADTIRLSEPLVKDNTSETFGAPLNTKLTKVSLAELATSSSSLLGKPFRLQTKIAKVCQKKGCFFIAQQDEHILRVSFKDYGFFIPTDSSGKIVTLTGELIQKEMTQEQAKHFAADLKDDSSTIKPGVVYEIVANSVKIPLS